MDFDFSKPYDSAEAIPADFRGLFAQGDDGKFALRAEDEGVKAAVAAIGRLNGALKAERAQHKETKGRAVDLSPLSEFGQDPASIAAAIKARVEELTAAGGSKVNVEKIKQELQQAHQKALDAASERGKKLEGQLREIIVLRDAVSALSEAGAIDAELALPHVIRQVTTLEEDGVYRAFVVDAQGDRRYSPTTGQPMGIRELVQEMKASEKFQPLFKSEARRGADTRPGASRQAVPTGAQRDQLSPTQKIALGLRGSRR